MNRSRSFLSRLIDSIWNLWCVVSVVGIWPRFIEPNLLAITHRKLPVADLPEDLRQLKILQISDLHLMPDSPPAFLQKILVKIRQVSPDIVVFTGDFLCYSQLDESLAERLKKFLNAIKAPYGCFAIFGNHDYEKYVSVNQEGFYDVSSDKRGTILRGFCRLFSTPKINAKVTPEARSTLQNRKLVELLKQTEFKILENTCTFVSVKNSGLNLCGLGEHMLGRCMPEEAFQNYDDRYCGIVLAHNPDSIPYLKQYPGDIVLCGHTHGGQINLPGLCNKFMLLENPQYKRGLFRIGKKWVYINRGLGSCMPFRWFSRPEISVFTLENLHAEL